jgi:hypothetical protein
MASWLGRSTVARMPPIAQARCRNATRAVHSSPSLKKGAARKVRRDSRPAIIFNSRCAPIMASRAIEAGLDGARVLHGDVKHLRAIVDHSPTPVCLIR